MKQIPVPATELAGTLIETLGYGIYLVVFPQTLQILVKKHVKGPLMAYLLGTMIISFICITFHLCVDVTRVFEAFTGKDITPEKFYAIVDTKLNLCKQSSLVITTLVADALLLYRTYVVWGRKWWFMIIPAAFYGVDIAMCVWFTWSVNEAIPGDSVLASTVFARAKYFYAATLAVNLVGTILIAFRVWQIQSSVASSAINKRQGGGALSIVVESAAIYSVALCCLIGLGSTDNSAMFFFLNSMPPLIGIVFSYVVLRSSNQERPSDSMSLSSGGKVSTIAGRSVRHSGMPFNRSMPGNDGGVHVKLERIVHHDEDFLPNLNDDGDKISSMSPTAYGSPRKPDVYFASGATAV